MNSVVSLALILPLLFSSEGALKYGLPPDLGADYLALAREVFDRIGRVSTLGHNSPRLTFRMGIRVFHCDDSEAFTRLVVLLAGPSTTTSSTPGRRTRPRPRWRRFRARAPT